MLKIMLKSNCIDKTIVVPCTYRILHEYKFREEIRMKKIIWGVVAIAVCILGIVAIINVRNSDKGKYITTSQLEKAVDIDELSTAEFVYNGVAEKYKDDDPEEVECRISYNATVKVGINMEDIDYKIDNKNKSVTPILPEIKVNIAALDESSISYIPKNPKMEVDEVIALCKEDAINEANKSDQLHDVAEENMKTTIEALIKPILDSKEYTIKWE